MLRTKNTKDSHFIIPLATAGVFYFLAMILERGIDFDTQNKKNHIKNNFNDSPQKYHQLIKVITFSELL